MRFSALFFLIAVTGCVSTQPVPPEWQSVPVAARITQVQLDDDGKVTTALRPVRDQGVRIENNRLMRGDKPLTDPFSAIDSFDVSESRGEVVFSVKRAGNFDIGLVSTDGSPISWVPAERVDEVGVQWAPLGNKISYVVRANGGDFVRTVHVPTAVQLGVDFPSSKIRALGWDPQGQRFAVAYSTPDASDRVETAHYEGKQRRMVLAPAVELDVSVESVGTAAIVVRPLDVAYGQKLPLVVWLDDEIYAWNDARAALMRDAKVAMVIARSDGLQPDLWRRLTEIPWIDANRAFVVSGGQALLPVGFGQAGLPVLHITSDPALPAGRWRRSGAVVAVAPAVVQSFAARFIANELKRTSPSNGSSR